MLSIRNYNYEIALNFLGKSGVVIQKTNFNSAALSSSITIFIKDINLRPRFLGT